MQRGADNRWLFCSLPSLFEDDTAAMSAIRAASGSLMLPTRSVRILLPGSLTCLSFVMQSHELRVGMRRHEITKVSQKLMTYSVDGNFNEHRFRKVVHQPGDCGRETVAAKQWP